MKKIWSHLPESVQKIIKGISIFLIISIVASLSFTSIASSLTVVGAVISGFYVAFAFRKKELLLGFLIPVLPNLLLQILFFSRVAEYMSWQAVAFLFTANMLVISLFGLIGGCIALVIRKNRDRKQKKEQERIKRKSDTRWIDRLFASIILVFYLTTCVLPVILPVHADEKITVDDFIQNYNPDTKYKVHAESVIETPKRRIPLEHQDLSQYYNQYPDIDQETINNLYKECAETVSCNFPELLEQYHQWNTEIHQLPPSLFEMPGLTLQGLTYGLFHWKDSNKYKQTYIEHVWGRTGELAVSIGKGLGYLWNNPKQAFTKLGNGALQFLSSYAAISLTYQHDKQEFYGKTWNNVMKGDVGQLFDFVNPFAPVKYFLDQRFPGGSGGFVKEVFSTRTVEKIAGVFVSQQTIDLVKKKEYDLAIAAGAGDVVGDIITFKTIGKIIEGAGAVGRSVVNFAKDLKISLALKTGIPAALETPSSAIIIRNGMTKHALEQATDRKITKTMINKTIEKGVKYYDRDKKTYTYLLDQGLASGKSLRVAVSPESNKVVTIINDSHFNPDTVLKDGGKRWVKVK